MNKFTLKKNQTNKKLTKKNQLKPEKYSYRFVFIKCFNKRLKRLFKVSRAT